jgi:polyhydroxybutyrate depolymerase
MTKAGWIAGSAALMVLVGCGPTQPTGTGGSAGTGGNPAAWGPGDYPPDINAQTYLDISGVAGQGNRVRQYKVHVPPNYDAAKPTPVVFCIHGLGQNAVLFCVGGAALNTKADQEGFILVMPNGYQSSWNAGTCCGGASGERVNDVALFRAIFAEVGRHLNIDTRRVYATGLSNGGYMSYRLGCEASDIFAAIAPGAGAVGINSIGGGTNGSSDFTECNPTRPVAVLDMHGTADPLIPYRLQAPSLAKFASADGCSSATVPATAPPSGGDTTCVTQTGCASGVEVTGCSVANGGHCWFGSPDCGTGAGPVGLGIVGANSDTLVNNDAVAAFFKRIAR